MGRSWTAAGAVWVLRDKQGASQEGLATEAGITPNMLSLIERGQGNPSGATAWGMAAALGVSVSELVRRAERLEG